MRTLILLATVLLLGSRPVPAQDRDTKVRNDRTTFAAARPAKLVPLRAMSKRNIEHRGSRHRSPLPVLLAPCGATQRVFVHTRKEQLDMLRRKRCRNDA